MSCLINGKVLSGMVGGRNRREVQVSHENAELLLLGDYDLQASYDVPEAGIKHILLPSGEHPRGHSSLVTRQATE